MTQSSVKLDAMFTQVDLNGSWYVRDFDPGTGEGQGAAVDIQDDDWLPALVPGDVHSDLIRAGRLADVYYHKNVEEAQWVEHREWWFRRSFRAPSALHEPDVRELLTFDGLDTYATVYLNGERLGEHANMFRPVTFDVAGKLRYEGENTIAVRFDPVVAQTSDSSIPGQWGGYGIERAVVRKRQSQFSWDWAPRLVNVGIWRSVRLERFQTARLHFPYVRTLAADAHHAVVEIGAGISWGSDDGLELGVRLSRAGRHVAVTVPFEEGTARASLSVPRPDLWWPAGYGEQALYEISFELRRNDSLLQRIDDRVGMRTIELDRSPDPEEPGAENFTFRVNDVPVFAKGANWIPGDCLVRNMTSARYEELMRLFVEANGNMLRVWGGGQYEEHDFYALADELGILVWQDFMFACARYPSDAAFRSEVQAEAEYQVSRLRNHACIALWAGNNENDWAEDLNDWADPGRDFPGKRLYHQELPEVVRRLDPGRPYWPSSPYGGNDHNGEQAGDRHNWHVWHGGILPRRFGEEPQHDPSPEGVSFRHYLEDEARFVSEFGMHASPVLETLQRNLPRDELQLGSEGLEFRNKDMPKNKGDSLMRAHTGLPRDLEEYVDFSMMCQAEGLKLGIEHYRRRKFHCSGALFWQWNDCWPGLSWSVLDYYAFPKAAYFYVKRAQAPVLASFVEEPDGGVAIWVTNDRLEPVEERLTWILSTFDGETLDRQETPVQVPANASQAVATLAPRRPRGADPRKTFLWLRGSDHIAANRHFFVELKDLIRERPAVAVDWEQTEGGLTARFSSVRHAHFVHLFAPLEGTRYSDNWFDLLPGEQHAVTVRPPRGTSLDPASLRVGWR